MLWRYKSQRTKRICKSAKINKTYNVEIINFSIIQSLQEMSQDCTDEAGKVKGSNPFIEEPAQSTTVVDMKGQFFLFFK